MNTIAVANSSYNYFHDYRGYISTTTTTTITYWCLAMDEDGGCWDDYY